MSFDGIVVKSIVSELNEVLIGGKVNKVFEPTKNDIILGLYSNGKNFALHICICPENCRINLTTNSKPNPMQAPNFCMLLRKYLIGARITSINTFGLERIVQIAFETYNELNDKVSKSLFVEIMAGHSNIILTNENNIIIDSLKHTSGDREIMPAREYVLPTNSKKNFNEVNSLYEFNNENIVRNLSENFIGISKSFVNSCLQTLNLVPPLSNANSDKLFNYINSILKNIETSNVSIVKTGSKDYNINLSKKENNLYINFFIDDFYLEKEQRDSFNNMRNSLIKKISSHLGKYSKRLDNINAKLQECESMEKYRLYGELITSNLYKLSDVHSESISLENYYDNNNLITIPIDKKFSLSKNAEKYFKKYNKLKNTLKIVSIQKQETELELEYIQSIIYSVENSLNLNDLNEISEEISQSSIFNEKKSTVKIKSKEPTTSEPYKFIIDGFTVFAGKNNIQNEFLTLKFANKKDIWFHSQNVQGSHVILKVDNKVINDDIIYKCAEIAMKNSKARTSTNVPVDYCEVKYVKKAPGNKTGMVVYTNYKTIIVK